MKNFTFYFASVILSCSLVGCGGSQSTKEKSTADSLRLDSLMKDSIKMAFTSPDLQLYDLKGHVHQCTSETYDTVMKDGQLEKKDKANFLEKLTFTDKGLIESTENSRDKHIYHYDEEGHFKKGEYISASGPAMKFTIKRNKENRIYSFEERSTDGFDSDSQYNIEYKYDKDGVVTSVDYGYWEATMNYKYTYNDKGLLTKETSEYSDYTLEMKTDYEYTYTEFDSCGNWISRVVTGVKTKEEIEAGVEESSGTATKEKLTPSIQTRTIAYY